jgi:hypothetical protein
MGGYSFDSLTVILKVGVPLLQNGNVKRLHHFCDHVPHLNSDRKKFIKCYMNNQPSDKTN